jgi:hypothetical protein
MVNREELRPVRYVGFEQQGNIRAYRFEPIAPIKESQSFTMEVDLTLFRTHHVNLQEGPALCLQLLMSELVAAGADSGSTLRCSITDQKMSAYVAARPAPGTKPGRRPAPAVSSPPV